MTKILVDLDDHYESDVQQLLRQLRYSGFRHEEVSSGDVVGRNLRDVSRIKDKIKDLRREMSKTAYPYFRAEASKAELLELMDKFMQNVAQIDDMTEG